MKKLCRTEGPEAKIFGVCGGLAKYFGLDPTLMRLITAVLILPGGMSLWVYLIAAFIMPRESQV